MVCTLAGADFLALRSSSAFISSVLRWSSSSKPDRDSWDRLVRLSFIHAAQTTQTRNLFPFRFSHHVLEFYDLKTEVCYAFLATMGTKAAINHQSSWTDQEYNFKWLFRAFHWRNGSKPHCLVLPSSQSQAQDDTFALPKFFTKPNSYVDKTLCVNLRQKNVFKLGRSNSTPFRHTTWDD